MNEDQVIAWHADWQASMAAARAANVARLDAVMDEIRRDREAAGIPAIPAPRLPVPFIPQPRRPADRAEVA